MLCCGARWGGPAGLWVGAEGCGVPGGTGRPRSAPSLCPAAPGAPCNHGPTLGSRPRTTHQTTAGSSRPSAPRLPSVFPLSASGPRPLPTWHLLPQCPGSLPPRCPSACFCRLCRLSSRGPPTRGSYPESRRRCRGQRPRRSQACLDHTGAPFPAASLPRGCGQPKLTRVARVELLPPPWRPLDRMAHPEVCVHVGDDSRPFAPDRPPGAVRGAEGGVSVVAHLPPPQAAASPAPAPASPPPALAPPLLFPDPPSPHPPPSSSLVPPPDFLSPLHG